jgi:hypothetical protein
MVSRDIVKPCYHSMLTMLHRSAIALSRSEQYVIPKMQYQVKSPWTLSWGLPA